MGSRIVVALGGNALAPAGGAGTWEEMRRAMAATAAVLAEIARDGTEMLLTHGNGPQVGALLRGAELAAAEVPPRPLYALGAETQGQLGLLIAEETDAAFARAGLPRRTVAWLSRMEVSRRDPEFRRPTKPIGAFYDDASARRMRKQRGWTMVHDAARGGWRRVVPSPAPQRWLEADLARAFFDRGLGKGWIPIVAGGGGVPVVRGHGSGWVGVDAVIDKDRASAVVARSVGARRFAILTDVPGIAVGFRTRWERWLGAITEAELARWEKAGEFPPGTMGPKVRAGLEFLAGGGEEFLVTDIPSFRRALAGETGTRVTRGP
ncbi:MAG: carbamate kinase [Thermoplasmata archaeon]